MKSIVVLISGNGSNLQAIINACKLKKVNGIIRAVFSNKANAFGLERARQAHIPAHIIEVSKFTNREDIDRKLIRKIDLYTPDIVVLAGYMRILSPLFVAHYSDRLLNIHPSLLPKYPGLNTHRRILKSGDKEHGASVHFITNELDGGPVILQAKTSIFKGNNEDYIARKIKKLEHIIYPLVISWFVDGRLTISANMSWLDGKPISVNGIQLISTLQK